MCRMIIDTNTDSDGMRRLLFNQLMLLSLADGNHGSGAGVSDGTNIYKSGLGYNYFGSQWLSKLDKGNIWMGHLRKASSGTDMYSSHAAHPYYFKSSGLIAQHNGFITESGDVVKGEPNTDSYRALKTLSNMLGDGNITVPLINEWVETFGPGSEWTIMLLHRSKAYIVRGIRPMHYIYVDGNPIFATSDVVLDEFSQWIRTYWSKIITVSKKVLPIREHSLTTIDLERKDKQIFDTVNLTGREKPQPYAGMYYAKTLDEERYLAY